MTRILQVRRGTNTQNDSFTGLAGELSFDTTNKTLRVHDGATIGGFTMARSDQVSSGGGSASEFDINSVPASFWQNIISTYCTNQLQSMESDLATISSVTYIECIFDIYVPAKFSKVVLICQTPEAGYSVGDTVSAFGIGSRTNPALNTFNDDNGLHLTLFTAQENLWVSNKTTGITTNITNSKWKAKFIVWY